MNEEQQARLRKWSEKEMSRGVVEFRGHRHRMSGMISRPINAKPVAKSGLVIRGARS